VSKVKDTADESTLFQESQKMVTKLMQAIRPSIQISFSDVMPQDLIEESKTSPQKDGSGEDE